MSENNNMQIREAENKVKIAGILKEIKLEEKDDIIKGDVVIQTDDKSEHSVAVYASKITKAGSVSKAHKGLQTIMKEYVSIAALMKDGKTHEEAISEATKISLNSGKLQRNEFYAENEFVSRPQLSSNFFNRILEDEIETKAEFEVECYFNKIHKEIKNNEETGRIVVEAIVPLYGGKVVPMDFAADGEVGDYIENNYEVKKTGFIWGDIINIAEHTVTKKSGFGKDKEDEKVNYKREFVITGGNEEQYDEDDTKAFTTEQIQQAWKVRETETIPELLKKSQEKNKGGAKSSGMEQSSKTTAPKFKF